MTIYLDFDGTLVEHKHPAIGKYNPGGLEVIRALQNKGHEIIINTLRSDIEGGIPVSVLAWLKTTFSHLKVKSTEADDILPITKYTEKKIHPAPFITFGDLCIYTTPDNQEYLFLDDAAYGTPLRKDSYMVDWSKIKQILEENNII